MLIDGRNGAVEGEICNRGGKRMSSETVPLASDSPLAGKAMLGVPAKQVQPQNTLLKECLFFIKIFFRAVLGSQQN